MSFICCILDAGGTAVARMNSAVSLSESLLVALWPLGILQYWKGNDDFDTRENQVIGTG